MSTSLGISAGSSGVGSALHADTPAGRVLEYRRLTADSDSGRELGDLVFDAISLMGGHIARSPARENITVAYRTEEQAQAVRVAAERRGCLVRLVPETTALLTFLRTVGIRAEPGAVAIADIGATGTTVSVIDPATGTLLRSGRTEDVSGNALGALIYEHVHRATETMRTRRHIDPDLLAARCLGAQEALTTAEVARIDIVEAGPGASVTLTRADLTELSAALADTAAAFTRQICAGAQPRPRTLALVGGTAGVPALADAISAAFDGDILHVPEPASAAAQGAALLGDSAAAAQFPLVGSTTTRRERQGGRTSGTVAAVLVVSAVLAGFATDRFSRGAASEGSVSPLMTSGEVIPPPEGEPEIPTETAIPSQDPDSLPVASVVPSEELRPMPVPITPRTTGRNTTVPGPGTTTVTPTPIDQVPMPDGTPDEATADRETAAPPATTTPDAPIAPDPEDTTTPPITTIPDTTEPDTTEPGTTEPGTTEPGTTEPGTTEPDADSPSPTDGAPADSPAAEAPAEATESSTYSTTADAPTGSELPDVTTTG